MTTETPPLERWWWRQTSEDHEVWCNQLYRREDPINEGLMSQLHKYSMDQDRRDFELMRMAQRQNMWTFAIRSVSFPYDRHGLGLPMRALVRGPGLFDSDSWYITKYA